MKAAALGATLLVVVVMASATSAAPQVRAPAIDFVNWSPNGHWLAFDYARDDAYQVRVVRPDGSAERKVLDSLRRLSFSWSPNSQRLAITDGETTWVATSTGRLRGRIDGRFEDWAPGSQRLLVTRGPLPGRGPPAKIFVIGLSPRSERLLAVGDGPDWSPDSRLIAFAGGAYGPCQRRRIYVTPPDRQHVRQVSPTSGALPLDFHHVYPTWSPRGRYVAFGVMLFRSEPSGCPRHPFPEPGDADGFRVPREGGAAVALGRGYPVWSPRGDLIALQRIWSNIGIEIVTPRGNSATTFRGMRTFDWSPLGRRIAYSDDAIYVATATGDDRQELTLGRAPDWSPLGGRIAFVKENEWNGTCGDRIFLIRPDWTVERAVTRCAG